MIYLHINWSNVIGWDHPQQGKENDRKKGGDWQGKNLSCPAKKIMKIYFWYIHDCSMWIKVFDSLFPGYWATELISLFSVLFFKDFPPLKLTSRQPWEEGQQHIGQQQGAETFIKTWKLSSININALTWMSATTSGSKRSRGSISNVHFTIGYLDIDFGKIIFWHKFTN